MHNVEHLVKSATPADIMAANSDEDEDVPIAVPFENTPPKELGTSIADTHKPVPVTLITGFLGAGKSTLVRHILTVQHGRRIAVIVNEFGDELGIERAIVNEHEGDGDPAAVSDWLELANGCLCCSIKGQLVSGLENLLRQRERFDYILIETSGLANPGPVAAALWTDPELEAGVALDGIITVADAHNLRRQLSAPPAVHSDDSGSGRGVNEAQQQLAYSDVVLLNKVDLESDTSLRATEDAIAAINPTASIVRTVRSATDLASILDIQAMAGLRELDNYHPSAQSLASTDAATARLASLRLQPRPQLSEASNTSSQPSADIGDANVHLTPEAPFQLSQEGGIVSAVSIRVVPALDISRVRQWVETLLWDRSLDGPDVFRIKGVLHVAACPRQQLLQGVCELYDITEGAMWRAGDDDVSSRVVVIGARLPSKTDLEAALLCCAVRA